MSFDRTKYWKCLDDNGKPVALYRRRTENGLIQMERYTIPNPRWLDAYDYLLRVIEDFDFVEITGSEAKKLTGVLSGQPNITVR